MTNTTNTNAPLVRKFTDKAMAGFSFTARNWQPTPTTDLRLQQMKQTIAQMQKYVPAIDCLLAEVERKDQPNDMYRDVARGFFVSFRNAVDNFESAKKLVAQQEEMPNEDATTRDGYTIGDLREMIGYRAGLAMENFSELARMLDQ